MNSRFTVYGLAVVPLLTYAVAEVLTYELGNVRIGGLSPEFTEGSSYLESAVRYRFQASMVLLFSIAAAAICVVVAEILKGVGADDLFTKVNDQSSLPPKSLADLIFLFFLIAATISTAFFFGSVSGQLTLYDNLGSELFIEILNHCHVILRQQADCVFGSYRNGMLPTGFPLYINLTTIFVSVGLAACSFGCCRVLLQTDGELSKLSPTEIFRLPRLFLYIASFLFTSAMLSVYSSMDWPDPFLSDTELDAYRELKNGVALLYATSFSLVILSLYLPTVLVLNNKISKFSKLNSSKGTGIKVPVSTLKILENALAILAPIIATLISASTTSLLDKAG